MKTALELQKLALLEQQKQLDFLRQEFKKEFQPLEDLIIEQAKLGRLHYEINQKTPEQIRFMVKKYEPILMEYGYKLQPIQTGGSVLLWG